MLINLERSYSYGDILRSIISLKNLYPKLIKIESAGISHDNREILLVTVGKGTKGPLFISGVHGRESINPIVLTAIIEKYAKLYYSSGEKLLNKYSFYFMPLLNPDGYEIATKGFFMINDFKLRNHCRNMNIQSLFYKYNARGIDINRNFASVSFKENDSSGKANSENETNAFIHACKTHEFIGMIDFHSRGKSIYYYREAMNEDYNRKQFDMACILSKISKYGLYLKQDENPDMKSGGNTVHYFSETFKLPAFTFESVDEEAPFPLDVKYQKNVFNELKNIPIEFLKLLISKH